MLSTAGATWLDNCEEESYINALLGFYLESKTVPNQTYKDILHNFYVINYLWWKHTFQTCSYLHFCFHLYDRILFDLFGWTPLHMRRPVANLLLCPLQLLTLPRLPMTPLSHPHRHLHLPTEKQVRSNLSASFNPISWVSLWDIADRMYTLGRLHMNMCPFLFIFWHTVYMKYQFYQADL